MDLIVDFMKTSIQLVFQSLFSCCNINAEPVPVLTCNRYQILFHWNLKPSLAKSVECYQAYG